MKPSLMLCADFDGTLFDPSIRILLSPVYNNHTSRLIRKNGIFFIVNTGRPIWDRFAWLQTMAIGLHTPDAVIVGAGTKILRKKRGHYVTDAVWEEKMYASGWNKQNVREAIKRSHEEFGLDLFDTKNPYMSRAWVYHKDIAALDALKKRLESELPDTKILLTEQILLPNTTRHFSGYLLFIPKVAGKETAAQYLVNKLEAEYSAPLKRIYAGDALVDVSMLLADASPLSASYGLNLTPLAREALRDTQVNILDGSPPALLLRILKQAVSTDKPRNSPFRTLLTPVESLIDRTILPGRTPDEISYRGLSLVKQGVRKIYDPVDGRKGAISGVFDVLKGTLMDVADGIRAGRHPQLKTPDGQLIDGYADRNKEFMQLAVRAANRSRTQKTDTFAAALSCFLPSIARAQAECLGATVPEYDPHGGSALSRNTTLIFSLIRSAAGFDTASYRSDMKILTRNMNTYKSRMRHVSSFDWKKLSSYDKTATERLKLYVEMFQHAVAETGMKKWAKDNGFEDYLKVKIKPSVLHRIRARA